MKGFSLVLMFFLIFTSFMSLNAQWARTYGGSFNDEAWSIQQTSDGGYIVAGLTESFGAGSSDIWILKLSSTGTIEWQRTYGGSSYETANSIQQTSDGGYIVAGDTQTFGAGSSDYWIIKLFPNGDIEWQRTYGGSSHEVAPSIQQTSDGGYIVAGDTQTLEAGSSDYWIIKLFPNGDIEWQRTYGVDNWNSARSIQQTIDGGYIVAGNTLTLGVGKSDYLVLKLSSTGDIEWQRTYGADNWNSAHSIQQTIDGGYIVAGETQPFGAGSYDYWVIKLFPNGDIEWQRNYGEGAAISIQQTNDGGYIVSGGSRVLKLSSTGNIEWQRSYGEIDFASSYSIQQTIDGGYIVAGNTWTCTHLMCIGDFFILKLLSDGDINSSCKFKGSSNALIADTYVSPVDTNITPDDTDVTPFDTNIIPQNTDATISLICEETLDDDSSGENGLCFIATAAYGSPIHPHLDILRDFRDTYVMPSKLGSKLVGLYYKYSPLVADLIARHKVLKIAVRINLLPLVLLSYSMLYFGPTITTVMLLFIFALPIFLISFFRRKLRRAKPKNPEALASRWLK
jgi:hypothetical protein